MFEEILLGPNFQPQIRSMSPSTSGQIYWDHVNHRYTILSPDYPTHHHPNTLMIDLDDSTKSILDWAKKKMVEESQLDELCEKHPGLNEVRTAFEAMKVLVTK